MTEIEKDKIINHFDKYILETDNLLNVLITDPLVCKLMIDNNLF